MDDYKNLKYKYMVGFQVPNFLIQKILVFQLGISKSNLEFYFRLSNVPSGFLHLNDAKYRLNLNR